jgi:hypothetical protein
MTGEVHKASIIFLVCLIISGFFFFFLTCPHKGRGRGILTSDLHFMRPYTLIRKGTLLKFASILLKFDYTIPDCMVPYLY